MGYVEMSPALAKAITIAKRVRAYEELTAKAPSHVAALERIRAVSTPPPPEPPPLVVELTPGWRLVADKGSERTEIVRVSQVRAIQNATCEWYRCSRAELLTRRRNDLIVERRYVAMYLCKTLTTESYPGIGRRFGGYDHTTIMHAVSRIGDMVSGLFLLNRLALYDSPRACKHMKLLKYKDRTGLIYADFDRDLAKVKEVRASVEAIRELVRASAGF